MGKYKICKNNLEYLKFISTAPYANDMNPDRIKLLKQLINLGINSYCINMFDMDLSALITNTLYDNEESLTYEIDELYHKLYKGNNNE